MTSSFKCGCYLQHPWWILSAQLNTPPRCTHNTDINYVWSMIVTWDICSSVGPSWEKRPLLNAPTFFRSMFRPQELLFQNRNINENRSKLQYTTFHDLIEGGRGTGTTRCNDMVWHGMAFGGRTRGNYVPCSIMHGRHNHSPPRPPSPIPSPTKANTKYYFGHPFRVVELYRSCCRYITRFTSEKYAHTNSK